MMSSLKSLLAKAMILAPAVVFVALTRLAQAADKPNILVILGDDVGWFNIGAYNRGIMAGKTPNIDKIAEKGMMFTDYYAEPSCTAGRANLITGELPIRTGLTTVGQAGAKIGMPDQAPTIATALKAMGYATGQFGKNHLGDLNQYLPCVHGFDEFFGYLYHLDAMEDPFWHSYPPALANTVGPRHIVHCWASDADDSSEQPRWGKIGKQKIADEGPLPPNPVPGIKYSMPTFDEVIRDRTIDFIDKAHKEGKPFFVWWNPTRVHVFTHLSEKYQKMMTPENSWYTEEAAMAQFDDVIGDVMKHLEDTGLADNTIVIVTADNGAENFTWPDGGQTPFAGGKGTILEGGIRVPAIIRWPGKVPAGKVENGIISGLDWFPTLAAAAGDPDIVEELKRGKQLGDRTYKVHLDGYNQMNMITSQGPSNRHEILYFAEGTLGAIRIDDFKYRFIDQPNGWFGGTVHVDWPIITDLRLDPFERTGWPTGTNGAFPYPMDFFGHEFWRFTYVQKVVGEYAQTFIQFPPMQRGASFNIEEVKKQVQHAIEVQSRVGQ
jgi:arylsulfatase A-like enzyme